MKDEQHIVHILIHGIVGEGYEISSVWDDKSKALWALETRLATEKRYECTPSGLYMRSMASGAREYLDVIPREVRNE